MLTKTLTSTFAAAVLFAVCTTASHAAQVPIPGAKGEITIGSGFSFFYEAFLEVPQGEVVFKCGMKAGGMVLVRNEARLRGNVNHQELRLTKAGKSGLEASGLVTFDRNGTTVSWHLTADVRNKYAPNVKPIHVNRGGQFGYKMPKVPGSGGIKIPDSIKPPRLPF